ncbi:hypothetical protein ACFV8E_39770 [Streptomyces sp. NPDC059849]
MASINYERAANRQAADDYQRPDGTWAIATRLPDLYATAEAGR